MALLSQLGEVSKASALAGYDPVFAHQQAQSPPPRLSNWRRAKAGAGKVRNIPPKKAGLIAAGAAGALGTGEMFRRDIKSQKRVNEQHPYASNLKGKAERQEHSAGLKGAVASGALIGGYGGYAADKHAQQKYLQGIQAKHPEWQKSKRDYANAPNMNEHFASERDRVRVQRLRAMRTSSNPNERANAESRLRNMGRPYDEPKKGPWEETAHGREYGQANKKFKSRYGVGMDDAATPENVRRIKRGAEKLAWKRGTAIGAVGLGGLSYLAARRSIRQERENPELAAIRRQNR